MNFNHKLMNNNYTNKDIGVVKNFLKNKDVILTQSKKVQEFEKKWSKWLGVKYSVFVNSGSSANLLCIALLKEKYPNGGDIIVPPFTWSSDISSIIWMGFNPVFKDINLSTLALNTDLVIEEIEHNNNVKAVFLTHAQGINGLENRLIKYLKEKNPW